MTRKGTIPGGAGQDTEPGFAPEPDTEPAPAPPFGAPRAGNPRGRVRVVDVRPETDGDAAARFHADARMPPRGLAPELPNAPVIVPRKRQVTAPFPAVPAPTASASSSPETPPQPPLEPAATLQASPTPQVAVTPAARPEVPPGPTAAPPIAAQELARKRSAQETTVVKRGRSRPRIARGALALLTLILCVILWLWISRPSAPPSTAAGGARPPSVEAPALSILAAAPTTAAVPQEPIPTVPASHLPVPTAVESAPSSVVAPPARVPPHAVITPPAKVPDVVRTDVAHPTKKPAPKENDGPHTTAAGNPSAAVSPPAPTTRYNHLLEEENK